MSKLYDAIKEIEDKPEQDDNLPNFSQKPQKPPYLLIVIAILIATMTILSAFIIKDKLSRIHNKKEKSAVVKVKKQPKIKKAAAKRVKKEQKQVNIQEKHKIIEHKLHTSTVKKIRKNSNLSLKKPKSKKAKKVEKQIKHKTPTIKKEVKSETKGVFILDKSSNRESTAQLLDEAYSGSIAVSIEAYKKLIKRFPQNVSLYNNLAVKYIDSKQYRKAIKILKRALKFSDDDDVKLNLVIAYIKIKEYRKARSIFRDINQSNIQDKSLLRNVVGILNSIN